MNGVAVLQIMGCGLFLALGGAAAACSSEQVQPANAMPGAMEEGGSAEMGAGSLMPAPTSPDDPPPGAPTPGKPPGELPVDMMPEPTTPDAMPPEAGAAGAGSRPPRPVSQRPPLVGEGPDLVLDAAYLLDSTRFETLRIDDECLVQQGCATGLGQRRVVRFGSRMGNVGNADLFLGAPNEQNPLYARDACTDGFSLPRFGRHELRDSSGRLVVEGSKNPVCITDSEEWIPESGADCQSFSCGRQGIAPGCADNYGIDLPCQWLDITDVPPGSYELEVILNAEGVVEELDYTNNSAILQLEITATGGTVRR